MESWTLIILGATGSLAQKRLIPTLLKMLKHQGSQLSFAFVGAARDKTTIEALLDQSLQGQDAELIAHLKSRSSYVEVDFSAPTTFKTLSEHIDAVEKKHQLSGNRLIYLAVSSEWYCAITRLLAEYGIAKNQKLLSSVHHRIVYEKPFGTDTSSARAINECIGQLFEEEQIYRIDHYLTKSLVTALVIMRFSNVFFESVWNNVYIDQVHIVLSEKESIKGRGSFYDHYGALKDVVQNHMFELLALIAMERPSSRDPHVLSEAKTKILTHMRVTDGILGQYEGYHDVPGVQPGSTRETYALLCCGIDLPRWQNVPFFLKTGKALSYKSTEIHLVFKPLPKIPVGTGPVGTARAGAASASPGISSPNFFDANRLIIRISPDTGVVMHLNTQIGFKRKITTMTIDFCFRCSFDEAIPHSYEMLFYEVMQGDRIITVSPAEIHASWDIISQIHALSLPLYTYKPGSNGPDAAEAFSQKHGIAWQENE